MNKAPIVGYAVTRFRSPICLPFSISRESLTEAEILIIALRDSQGGIYLGECSPFPSLTGDTVNLAEQCAHAICRELIGRSGITSIASMAEYRQTSVTAVSGVEIALWDMFAKQEDRPLSSLCGSSNQTVVESDITLPIMTPDKIDSFWNAFGDFGFRIVKIKVSGNVEADLDMVMALVKSANAKKIELTYTLDGNQGFTAINALKLLELLQRHNVSIDCFEQPLPAEDWSGLKNLSEKTPVPICLDETVKTPDDCRRAINEKTAAMINLKIMKSGFRDCLEIGRLAQAAGIKLMIGGMLESEIAMTASLHLACGLGGIKQHDLDTPFFFSQHPTNASSWHKRDARLAMQPGNGLGLTLADSILKNLMWC